MRITDRRKAQQARHALETITPRQVEAMRALDHLTLSDLQATVAEIVAAVHTAHAPDVEAYAMTIAADVYAGTPDVRKAARKAVKIARTRVAEAYALDDHLTDWEGETEDAIRDTDRAPGSLGSDRVEPEAVVLPSAPDMLADMVWSGIGNGIALADALAWSRAVVLYLDHLTGAHECPVCQGRPATKRPTFATVTAHVEGRKASGKAGQAHRASLARVAAYLTATGARDAAMRHNVTGKAARVRLGHDVGDYFGGSLACTVEDGAGNVRTLTPVEVWAVARANAWAVPVDWDAFRADPRHNVGAPGANGQVPSGKRPTPRKRSGSSGATGSTIPARF